MLSLCDKIVLKLLAIILTDLFLSGRAHAFPDFIKDGYGSCKGCHYDSSGGGPLTSYGRTIAEEKLSMFSFQGEGEAFYGWVGTHPFGVSGDFRQLYHSYEDDTVKIRQTFPMQKELSLTFDPAETVSFIGSAGYYGFEPEEIEYRRYYVRLNFKGLGARAGRFMPAFGYNIPDHTKAIKRDLFSQGTESLNAEISYTHRYFELFATRLLGSDSRLSAGRTPKVLQRDDRDGMAFKGSLFFSKGIQVGYSHAMFYRPDGLTDEYSSLHVFLGLPRLWLLGELQKHPAGLRRGYGAIGLEPVHGLWLKTEVNYTGVPGENAETFGTVQFFPRPHFELSTSASLKQLIVIGHWYI